MLHQPQLPRRRPHPRRLHRHPRRPKVPRAPLPSPLVRPLPKPRCRRSNHLQSLRAHPLLTQHRRAHLHPTTKPRLLRWFPMTLLRAPLHHPLHKVLLVSRNVLPHLLQMPPLRSRVGSVINDGAGNPSLCLVQLWACRKKCGSCENAFCQATFPDRSNSFHTLHRCRDCKRAEGRNRANQPAPASADEGWHQSNWEWNSEWNSNAWTPAWGSQDGWQDGWHHGWHQ